MSYGLDDEEREERRQISAGRQIQRLEDMAYHMRKFEEVCTAAFAAASAEDRVRLHNITKPRECEGEAAVFDASLMAFELQEWADESTKEDA